MNFGVKNFILTLTIGCPETSAGDEALAVKMARDATKIKKKNDRNNYTRKNPLEDCLIQHFAEP